MRRDLARRRPVRALGRRVVVACEGEKTEYGYLEGIRQHLRLSTVQIVVLRDCGTDPRSVVERVVGEREVYRREHTWMPTDTAWALFDGDEHISNNPVNWQEAIDIARRKSVHLAVSNPAFELWYLLHYEDCFRRLDRQQALRKLQRYLPAYEKAARLYPDPLAPLTDGAIARARDLRDTHARNRSDDYCNPSCGVHALVTELLALVPPRQNP